MATDDDEKRSFTPGRSEPASGKSVFELLKSAETADAVRKIAKSGMTITGPRLKAALGADYEAMTPRQAANLAWRVKNHDEYQQIIGAVTGATEDRRDGAINKGALKAMRGDSADSGLTVPSWRRTGDAAPRAEAEKLTGAYIGRDGMPKMVGLPDIGMPGGTELSDPKQIARAELRNIPYAFPALADALSPVIGLRGASAVDDATAFLHEISPPRQAEMAGEAFAKGQELGDPMRMGGALAQGLLGGVVPVATAGAGSTISSLLFGTGARQAGTVGAGILGGAAAAGALSPTPAAAQSKGKKTAALPELTPPTTLDAGQSQRWVELSRQLNNNGSLPGPMRRELDSLNAVAAKAAESNNATSNAIALQKASAETEIAKTKAAGDLHMAQQVEAARVARELRETSANTSIKSEQPWFAPTAAAAGAGVGTALAYLASRKATGRFNTVADDLALRSKSALDEARTLMSSGRTGDAHMRMEEALALDKELRGVLNAGPSAGSSPMWAAIGGTEVGLNAPSVVDYIKSLPGSDLRKNAFGDPTDIGVRVGGGALTGAGLGKMASVAGGLGRSAPTSIGVHDALGRVMDGKGAATLGNLSAYSEAVDAANASAATRRQALSGASGTPAGGGQGLLPAPIGATQQSALQASPPLPGPQQIPHQGPSGPGAYDLSVHHPISKKVIMDALDLSTQTGKSFASAGRNPDLLAMKLVDAHQQAGAPPVELSVLRGLASRWVDEINALDGTMASAGRAVTNPAQRSLAVDATSGRPGQLAIPAAVGGGIGLASGSPEASAQDLQSILDRVNAIAQRPAGSDLENMLRGLSDSGEWGR
jgi:hypothetical protein